MDYQIALEACRAYKECHIRLRKLGLGDAADEMQTYEKQWRLKYMQLANDQQANSDVE